jgi:hypothetical protein
LRRLALQSGVSVGSAWTATQPLQIHLYEIAVLPEIKPVDYERKERGYVIGPSNMCLTDFLILS